MSEVDERIVQMRMETSGFEAGATKAAGILDKLKNSLKMEKASSGLDAVQKKASAFSLNGVSDSVMIVSSKFSAFEEFVTGVFRRLGARAADFGLGLIRNVTIKPITDGFSEYETQMRSIQTISANTGLKGDEGIAKINSALDELNEYADKTIYNFSEMTRNIGTFTAAGVDLDTSTKAIQGIANLAAVSGSSSQQASTAMYQLSQALASGTVKLQDWNSVVNANMGGKVFQEALKRTARAHGVAVDDMIKKNGSFRESLKEGWITSDILTETLGQMTIQYDEVGDAAYEAAFKQLTNSNYSEEDAKAILELAKTAEEAATMVRTWTQLWETVGEALGSGWATSFRIILGDFNQATELFTYLSNELSDIIGKSSDARNAMLSVWADDEVGGRKAMFGAIVNILTAIKKPLLAIADAFDAVFGISGEELATMTEDFARFTERLVMTDEQADALAGHFDTIFSIISDGLSIASTISSTFVDLVFELGNYITPLVDKIDGYLKSIKMTDSEQEDFAKDMSALSSVLSGAGYVISQIAGYFIDLAGNIAVAVDNANVFHHITKIIQNVAKAINRVLRPIRFAFEEVFGFDKSFFDKLSGGIGSFLRDIEKFTEGLIISGETEQKLHDRFKEFFELIKSFGGPLDTIREKLGEFFGGLVDDFKDKDIFGGLVDSLASLDFGGIFNTLSGGASIGIIGLIAKAIKDFVDTIAEIKTGKIGIIGTISDLLDTAKDSLEAWQNNLKSKILIQLGIAVGIIAASLWVLSRIPAPALIGSLGAVATSLAILIFAMNQLPNQQGMAKSAGVLVALGVAIGLIALSLKLLSTIDIGSLVVSVLALAAILAMLVTSLNNMPDSGKLISSSVALIAIGVSIGLLSASLKLLSTIDIGSLVVSVLALGAILAMLVTSLNNMPDSGKLISSSVALIAIGVSIGLLSVSLKLLSTIDAGALANSLLALMTMLIATIGSLNMMPDGAKLLAASAALIALGVSMGLFALSLKLLSTIDADSLGNSLLALMVILVAVTGALNMMPDGGKLLGASAAMIAMGVAVGILALSLKLLSTIDGNALAASLVSMIVVMGALVGAMALLSGIAAPMLAVSLAMIGLGVAVGLLALSLKVMSTIPFESLGPALLALVGVFVIMAGAMALLSGLAAPTLIFTASMIGLSVAALLLAHALAILIPAITPVVSAMVNIGGNILQGLIDGFMTFVDNLGKIAGLIFDAIVGGVKSLFGINSPSTVMADIGGNVIQGLIDGIGNLIGSLGAKAGEIFTAVTDKIKGLPQWFADKASGAGDALAKGIGGFAGKVAGKVGELGKGAIDGLKNLATGFGQKGTEGGEKLNKNLAAKTPAVKQTSKTYYDNAKSGLTNLATEYGKIGKNGSDSLAKGLSGGTGAVRSAASGLGSAARSGVGSISLYSVGSSIVDGFVRGITDNQYKGVNAAIAMAKNTKAGAAREAQVKSPSRVFMKIGGYIADGFAIGIRGGIKDAGKAGTDLAAAVPEAFSDSLNSMSFNIEDILDTDYNPVISPVIDPTEFNYSLASLNSSLNSGLMDNLNIGNVNYSGEIVSKLGEFGDYNKQALQAFADNAIDYNQLGNAVAGALIASGVHVEIDGGKLMGYLAGEIQDARRMYK